MSQTAPASDLFRDAYLKFQQGDLATAEALLLRLLAAAPQNSEALHLLGVLKIRQGDVQAGAGFLARAAAVQPRHAALRRNLGKALMQLGRAGEAVDHLSAAVDLQPDLFEAWFELGSALDAVGRLGEAENAYRKLLALQPAHVPAKLALGAVLIQTGRMDEAEPLLRQALSQTGDPRMEADLHHNLSLVARKQQRLEDALHHLERQQTLAPSRRDVELHRADLLEELHRFDDAKAIYERMLAQNPEDVAAHHGYNELLYRLGDEANFLSSYANAPKTLALLLAKANFLSSAKRGNEAHAVFAEGLALFPGNRDLAVGMAVTLTQAGRFAEAIAAYEKALRHFPEDADIYGNFASALLQAGEPEKGGAMATKALATQPADQLSLALLGTSWRMQGDARDEWLNGYDEFIRIFELEPPEGFSSMAAFNAELLAYLESLHPPVREYLRLSLRGGSQTPGHLFGSGHRLVEMLRERFQETVTRYIAELRTEPAHPFLSRRPGSSPADFRFSGSWSSRLRDKGFHVNHIHPNGWISSCYYVDVPGAVKDETARQGWIAFGVPNFAVDPPLPLRRAIQPVPGQLILFPSYMCHGTIPFDDPHPRTTIAFDVVPV